MKSILVSGAFEAYFKAVHRTLSTFQIQTAFTHNSTTASQTSRVVMTQGKACEALSQDFGIHVAGSLEDVNYTVPWP